MNAWVLKPTVHTEYLDDDSNKLISLTTRNEHSRRDCIKSLLKV